jgi:hypothetical protein
MPSRRREPSSNRRARGFVKVGGSKAEASARAMCPPSNRSARTERSTGRSGYCREHFVDGRPTFHPTIVPAAAGPNSTGRYSPTIKPQVTTPRRPWHGTAAVAPAPRSGSRNVFRERPVTGPMRTQEGGLTIVGPLGPGSLPTEATVSRPPLSSVVLRTFNVLRLLDVAERQQMTREHSMSADARRPTSCGRWIPYEVCELPSARTTTRH